MKSKIEKLVVGIFISIFLGNVKVFGLESEQIKLPQQNKKIYTASENKAGEVGRNYWLKVKLKPKVIKSRIYWQDKEKVNWEEEIKNWQFGYLSQNENLPPIIIYKENFYPEEENWQGKFRWMSNNARVLVLNPIKAPLRVNFIFKALSYKKERKLEIWINGRKASIIKVPLDKEYGFKEFVIKNIVLNPGKNEIIFYTPGGTDKLKPKKWEKEKEKKVSIKFKDDFKFLVKGKLDLAKSESKILPEYKYAIADEGLSLFVNFKDSKEKILLASRDLDIDLEEFPVFNFDFGIDEEIGNLNVFLGIDYNGDGSIDGYLNPEDFKGINLLKLAKDKWQNADYFKYGFKLKKIILMLIPNIETMKKEQVDILEFKNFNFHNRRSLMLVGEKFEKEKLKFENVNVKSALLKSDEGIDIMVYFDGAPVRIKNETFREGFKDIEENKKRENEEVRVYLPLDKNLIEDFPYLSFNYKLNNQQVEEVKLYLSIQDNKGKNLIPLDKNNYEKSGGILKINLKGTFKKFNPEELVIRLKKKNNVDCSLENNKGWYRFQLSNIYLSAKFPYPIKTASLKKKFLFLISKINPELVKIDKRIFYLNNFQNWQNFNDLERKTLVKEIKLTKGNHKYEKLENDTFNVEWTILEPARSPSLLAHSKEPNIIFKKINPTKYLVRVERAKEPFWLVFSESFHKQWRLYKYQISNIKYQNYFKKIVAEYPKLGVKEARHLMRFTPQDIRYLFRKPLPAGHYLVNGYANGWYIEPDKLGLGKDFVLVIYFWPQSLFYLGLGISGLTLIFCLVYLVYDWRKRVKSRKLKGKSETKQIFR